MAPGGLSHVLGEGGRLAVVDVESTGLYRTDRVLEVAVVVLVGIEVVFTLWEYVVKPLLR